MIRVGSKLKRLSDISCAYREGDDYFIGHDHSMDPLMIPYYEGLEQKIFRRMCSNGSVSSISAEIEIGPNNELRIGTFIYYKRDDIYEINVIPGDGDFVDVICRIEDAEYKVSISGSSETIFGQLESIFQ